MRLLAQASDAQLRIGESILIIVVMDSGLALRTPRNDSLIRLPILRRQQEVDRGGARPAGRIGTRIAKRLAVIAAFRMRLQVEPRDDLGSTCRERHQDLFLRSRNSPNTSAALAPFM